LISGWIEFDFIDPLHAFMQTHIARESDSRLCNLHAPLKLNRSLEVGWFFGFQPQPLTVMLIRTENAR
jgi:hypothetical protein